MSVSSTIKKHGLEKAYHYLYAACWAPKAEEIWEARKQQKAKASAASGQ